MKKYKIIFSDKRKKETHIEAKNLKEALEIGKKLFGSGWAFEKVSQKYIKSLI